MTERSTDAIQLPHNQRIASPQIVEGSREAGPFSDRAAAGVFVNTLATGSLQGIALQPEVLLRRGDAHVADQHGLARVITKT